MIFQNFQKTHKRDPYDFGRRKNHHSPILGSPGARMITYPVIKPLSPGVSRTTQIRNMKLMMKQCIKEEVES